MLKKKPLSKIFHKFRVVFLIFTSKCFTVLFSKDGLIIALLLGILINTVSSIVVDKVQRQRYLELLELEMRMNHVQALGDVNQFKKNGVILNFLPYNNDVYEAGLQSGYLLSVKDPNILGEIYSFYSSYLPKVNQLLSNEKLIIDQYQMAWENCINQNLRSCTKEEEVFRQVEKQYSHYIYDGALALDSPLWEISKKFNPTADRLRSPLLQILMGNVRLKIQE